MSTVIIILFLFVTYNLNTNNHKNFLEETRIKEFMRVSLCSWLAKRNLQEVIDFSSTKMEFCTMDTDIAF